MSKLALFIIFFMSLEAKATDSYSYIGFSHTYQYLQSNNSVWDKLNTTSPSFILGRRFHPRYATEIKFSSMTYKEPSSENEPDILNSQFDSTKISLGVRFFIRKNLNISIGYEYNKFSRKITLTESSTINPSFYAYDKAIHGVYGTIGYQVFVLKSIDLFSELEISSNENYHSISAVVGLRFYPSGLFK